MAVAEYHRLAKRPTPFVYISTPHLWLPVLHLLQSRPPSSPPRQTSRRRVCPPSNAAAGTRIHCFLLGRLSPSLSLLLSYQHHLARSGTQQAATPLRKSEACLPAAERFTGCKCVCKGCFSPQSFCSPAFYSKLPSRARGP